MPEQQGYVVPVSMENFFLETAKGRVPGHSHWNVPFGAWPINIDDGFVQMWDGFDLGIKTEYIWPSGATIDTISSDNTGDDGYDIWIRGLLSGFELYEQTIQISGQNKVTLDTPLRRIIEMENRSPLGLNGNIFCYEDTAITTGRPNDGTKVKAAILAEDNRSLTSLITIPSGHTGYILDGYASIASTGVDDSEVKFYKRPHNCSFIIMNDISLHTAGNSFVPFNFKVPIVLSEKTDLMAETNADHDGVKIIAEYDILLVENTYL